MDGHVARFEIPASRLPDSLQAGSVPAAAPEDIGTNARTPAPAPDTEIGVPEMETAMARQLLPLSEQIEALQFSIRLHDILGGVGYVVGIFGLFAFMKARSRRTGEKSDP
jgi:nickel transport protein